MSYTTNEQSPTQSAPYVIFFFFFKKKGKDSFSIDGVDDVINQGVAFYLIISLQDRNN